MKRAALILLTVPLLLPADATAKPFACKRKNVKQAVEGVGGSTAAGFAQFICRDVTGDGRRDALFTVDSGGTARATQFGVFSGRALVLLEDGYSVRVKRDSARRFRLQQPYYAKRDPNCCPSAFDVTPYRWSRTRFEPGRSKRFAEAQF